MKSKLNYNQIWTDYFRVDETSPSGLVKIQGESKQNIGVKSFRKDGSARSWRVSFQGKLYTIHRIIWVLIHGDIASDLVIDHLDGNPFNNHIDNLSLKTSTGNSMNKRKYSKNKSGCTGVRLRTPKRGGQYYVTQWTELDGSKKFKLFSISKLGESEAKQLAITYREEQIRRLISEGADYTARHGN